MGEASLSDACWNAVYVGRDRPDKFSAGFPVVQAWLLVGDHQALMDLVLMKVFCFNGLQRSKKAGFR